MKFLKNNLKVIIAFILGLILAGGIVYAATSAKDVTYTTAKNGSIKNVEEALNDLYTLNAKNSIKTIYFLTWSGVSNGFYFSNYQDYKFFKITQTETGTSSSVSITKYNWSNNGSTTTLSLDTKYEITADNEQIVISPNSGFRNIKVEFFKE